MAMRAAAPIGWLAAALTGAEAAAVELPPPSPTPAAVGDQRLVFSTNGSRLTGGIGGGGGSATRVGSPGERDVIGLGGGDHTITVPVPMLPKSEEHTPELQPPGHLVWPLLLQ